MQSNTPAHEYAELRQLLAQQGLFDRQPMYYTGKALQNLSFLVLAVGILVTTNVFWLQMLNAAFLAADAGEPVRMSHLLRAARSEYDECQDCDGAEAHKRERER